MTRKNIIFIGDSYGASFKRTTYGTPYWTKQGISDYSNVSHVNVLAEKYDAEILNFCFGGTSWWWSRDKFLTYLRFNPTTLDNNIAMVFFHTDSHRLNTSLISQHTIESFDLDNDTKHAIKMYYAYLMDEEFHYWAQTKWFEEINNMFKDQKTIHFTCFTDLIEEKKKLLPGVFFTTPLVHLSIAELVGSKEEINQTISSKEIRNNHLNDHNNIVLANVIFDAIENYVPGNTHLPLEQFDIQNRNAFNWPLGEYWTK